MATHTQTVLQVTENISLSSHQWYYAVYAKCEHFHCNASLNRCQFSIWHRKWKCINPSISEISNLLVRWIKAMTDNSALISQNIHNDAHEVHIFCDGLGLRRTVGRPCYTSSHFPTGPQDQCRHHKLLNMIIKPCIKGVAIYISVELHSLPHDSSDPGVVAWEFSWSCQPPPIPLHVTS